jgi:uncharacterized protein (DUF2345 family)
MRLSFTLAAAAAVLGTASTARAVDLSKHAAGVGAVSLPADKGAPTQLSVRTWVQPRLALQGLLGLSSGPRFSVLPGVGTSWVLVGEQHMNVSLSAAGGLHFSDGLRSFAYRVGPEFELFTPEWPNLGLLVQFGLSGTIASKDAADPEQPGLTTGAAPFGAAGFHYYF